MLITDVVWEEFVGSSFRPDLAALDEELLRAVAEAPWEIKPQSVEAATFAKLEASTPQIDPGELSILSVTLNHPDVVPVLNDRRALYRALEETRGQVVTFHWFVQLLRDSHGLASAAANVLATGYTAKTKASAPLWW